ncbi:hypothetical protein JNK13_07885 [bacterium]|nr:hypothetical protein [bacterium]
MEDFKETLVKTLNVLAELGIPHLITGGLAASYYGEPRFTQDIDIVKD